MPDRFRHRLHHTAPRLAGSLLFGVSSVALALGTAAPRIDTITPDHGPISGGTEVVLLGANLADATVRVDRTAVLPTSQSATEIRFTAPPHGNGIVLVAVAAGGERSYAEFLYLPPSLSSLPPGYITTVAGIGLYLGDGRQATQAAVEPVDVMVDPDGSIVIVEESSSRVRRIRPDGVIEPLAGTGEYGLGGDGGDALDASFAAPRAVARDAAGNLLIADLSPRVRRVDATTGVITTIAGIGGTHGYGGDGGPAVAALLNGPAALAADSDGSIFVLDSQNYRIRRLAADGTISTYAGIGEPGYSGDGGPAVEARIFSGIATNGGLALDAAHNLYLADTANGAVRRIDRMTGVITTVVRHDPPGAIAFGPDGDLYVCSESADRQDKVRILRFNQSGELVATYGRGIGSSPDGTPAATAPLDYVNEIAVEPDGDILITEVSGQRLRRIDAASGLIWTAAGIGNGVINEEGPALETSLHAQGGDLAHLPGLGLVLSDTGNYRFRAIDGAGMIRTLFFVRTPEGVPTMPYGFDSLGSGAIAFGEANRVYRLDDWRTIRVVAGGGSGEGTFGGDGGPATEAILWASFDVAVELDGSLLIADQVNNRIRRVDAATGIISTVAGSGPPGFIEAWCAGSFCGDGGPADAACLNQPQTVAVGPDGSYYIGDACNARLRRVDPSGVISTFSQPDAAFMTFDKGGNLYGGQANSVTRYSPSGIMARIAGGQEHGFGGDGGPALEARVSAGFPSGIAIDPEGNVYFRDGSQRIRAVRLGAVLTPPGAAARLAVTTPLAGDLSAPLPQPAAVAVEEAGAPWPHVRVDFAAPPSGPSCVFANGERTISVLTDARGIAEAPCTATCTAGTFEIVATPLGREQILLLPIVLSGSSPAPSPSSVLPVRARVGHAELELVVRGNSFSPCSAVLWDGASRPTRFVSPTELVTRIPANDLAASGSHAVTVSTPGPGGGVSPALAFEVFPFRPSRRLGRS